MTHARSEVTGRFAPSPTGPLHLGSLLAAVGSWLVARSAGGRWLVRMEDLDTPRVRAGSADEILHALERFGLTWDGSVVHQSQRHALYAEALGRLRAGGQVYDCACSRADLQRAASAPAASDQHDPQIYPGTCRGGLAPGREARAVRFRVPEARVTFDDLVRGAVGEDVARATGDFVVKRADGIWAYQLAVVVDDEAQGVTQVVRGGDLLDSTARQITLQRALGYDTPVYGHLPLLVDSDGSKLGKRHGALPLSTLDERQIAQELRLVLGILGIDATPDAPQRMLESALASFDVRSLRMVPPTVTWSAPAAR